MTRLRLDHISGRRWLLTWTDLDQSQEFVTDGGLYMALDIAAALGSGTWDLHPDTGPVQWTVEGDHYVVELP